MNNDPKERQRIEQELKNLQATRNQYANARDRSRDLAKHYGNNHPTGQHAEREAEEYNRKIERLDRDISSLTSRL
ncbi:MAG: hypothetical protein WBW94_11900 [Anaerolineales bacterium]